MAGVQISRITSLADDIALNLAVADIVPCGVIRFTAISLLTGGVLALVVFLAIWYPARKAARQEPADALRYDG